MTIPLTLICGFWLACLGVIIYLMVHAPLGREDQDGFHEEE